MFFLKMICKPIAHPIYMSICHYLPIPPLRPVQQTSRHLRPLFDPKTILRGRLFARARARPPARGLGGGHQLAEIPEDDPELRSSTEVFSCFGLPLREKKEEINADRASNGCPMET